MLAIIVSSVLIMMGAASAQRIFPIVELTDADVARIDVHDASIDDWLEVSGEPTLTGLDFVPSIRSDPYDPADMDFRIWLAWHDPTDRIFVAMERSDDMYANEYQYWPAENSPDTRTIWSYDSYISFDGDRSGGGASSFWASTAQWYLAIAEVFADVPQLIIGSVMDSFPFVVQPPFGDVGGGSFGQEPTLSVTEFYVTPFDRLMVGQSNQVDGLEQVVVSSLHVGKIIGFAIAVLDIDMKSEEFDNVLHLRSENAVEHAVTPPDFMVEGLLVGPGEIPPDENTVR